MWDWEFAKCEKIPYLNCLCRPTALVEVEEIACCDTDERLTVTGKVVHSGMMPRINKVIFNDPATIVFWSDGTKTVVKAYDEIFDREKGLAMAISKKFFGNKGNYFNVFKKYCTRGIIIDTKAEEVAQPDLQQTCNNLATDLISRQDAIKTAHLPTIEDAGYEVIRRDDILALPSAEPERNTGEWITDAYGNIMCSECGWNAPRIMTGSLANRHLGYEKSAFCWHCGAYMRGEADERNDCEVSL